MNEPRGGVRVTWGDQGARPLPSPPPLPLSQERIRRLHGRGTPPTPRDEGPSGLDNGSPDMARNLTSVIKH